MNETETLVEQEKIRKQLHLYCKAIDAGDWAFLKTLFADEHSHQHGSFTGSADEFIGFASHTIKILKACQHSLTNVMINLSQDGLSATSESNFYAVHAIEGYRVPEMHFDAPAVDTDWVVAGIYEDCWVKREGKWLMIKRKATHIWERVEPARLAIFKNR